MQMSVQQALQLGSLDSKQAGCVLSDREAPAFALRTESSGKVLGPLPLC